MPHRLNTTKI